MVCRTAARGALCLALLPLMAGGQGDNGPFPLRMKFAPDEVARYQTSAQMKVVITAPNQPQPVSQVTNMSMVEERKVQKVAPDGSGEIATTLTNVLVNGDTIAEQRIPPITMRITPQGKLITLQGAKATNPMGDMLGSAFGSNGMGGVGVYLRLPPTPVKPGDTWTQPVSLPQFSGVGTVKCTFVSLETIGHYRTARIRTVTVLPLSLMMDADSQPTRTASQAKMTMTGKLQMTGVNNFAIAEGKLIRAAGNGTITLSMKHKLPPGKSASPSHAPSSRAPASHKATPPPPPPYPVWRVSLEIGMDLIQ